MNNNSNSNSRSNSKSGSRSNSRSNSKSGSRSTSWSNNRSTNSTSSTSSISSTRSTRSTSEVQASSDKGLRLNKYIATAHGCSRRDADRLIESGRVKLNNNPVVLGDVYRDGDKVSVDGKVISPLVDYTYIKFYKPAEVLSTYGTGTIDTEGRLTLMDIPLVAKNKLPYSGRLDYDSEGLMIFSNDRDMINLLAHPSHHTSKVYRVWVSRSLTEVEIESMTSGLLCGEIQYAPCHLHPIGLRKYSMTIYEGKNRQIRNMFGVMGVHVQRLQRVSIASVRLDNMQPGDCKPLTSEELRLLRKRLDV